MPLPNIYATAYLVYGSDEKAPFVAVLHYRQVGVTPLDNTNVQALADSIDNNLAPLLINSICTDSRYIRTTVFGNDAGVVFELEANGNAGPGVIGTESLPDFTAALIRKHTAVGGQVGRGRWFIGCLAENANDTGRITSAAVTYLSALAGGLIADQVAGGITWQACHLSRTADTLVQIVSASVRNVLVTQRRRRLRPLI